MYGKILQNEQDEEDLRQAFRVLDKNRRGEIDVDDLRWILKELGDDLTEEEIDEMIRDTDRDGSGFVDFDGGWLYQNRWTLSPTYRLPLIFHPF